MRRRASIASPKPGYEIFTLPMAIVRAVDDGADVVLCATYVDGSTSPLLDDALSFARHLGRGGSRDCGRPAVEPRNVERWIFRPRELEPRACRTSE